MNTTSARTTTTHQVRHRARRVATLAAAGAVTCLALVPTLAYAARIPPDIPLPTTQTPQTSHDIDDVVLARKLQMSQARATGHVVTSDPVSLDPKRMPALAHILLAVERYGPRSDSTCYIPETLDSWSRRLIAVQLCSGVRVVPAVEPAVLLARAPYGDPASSGAVGHCGHESAHQPQSALGLPVSAWYTPTSC
ncbi:hypothetical protein EKO23_06235 [Nocardioides guangzhouensis]|uniref:Uncharacterized protein n=1 Tax=Nocardioides guangzhouensis TaxID=2497878 RepID=A0A4Q4ZHC8_9ACTN|nr:hypothetical protein [Nocardioides guangzhouensis]RYP87205.1 hypothetical protein EKO23_06235 [Nocardioides guangzhouensis]